MKNLESMQNPAQEPKKPLVQEGDVEHLMMAFEEADKEKAAQAAVDSDPEFAEIQAENDAKLKAEADAYRAKELAWLYKTYRLSFSEFGVDAAQHGGISAREKAMKDVYTEMYDMVADHLPDVMEQLATEPELALRALPSTIEQRLKQRADPNWDTTFRNISHPQVKELYISKIREIRHEAAQFLTTLLQHEIDNEEEPEKISALHKLLEGVEAYKERID